MRMKLVGWMVALTLGFGSAETIRFDMNAPGSMPAGWTVVAATDPPPKWEVLNDPTAPSKPNVLALVSKGGSGHFPLAILDKADYKDGEVSVKFKTMAGKMVSVTGMVMTRSGMKGIEAASYKVAETAAK